MRPELERIKYIEDYLEGRLSDQEAQEFEAVMESNPELKKDVEFQKDLSHRMGHAALVTQIDAAHQRFVGKKPFWYNLNTWLVVALVGATVLAVIGISATLDDRTSATLDDRAQGGEKNEELLVQVSREGGNELLTNDNDSILATSDREAFLNKNTALRQAQGDAEIEALDKVTLRPSKGDRKDDSKLSLSYPGTENPTDKAGERWFSKVEVPFSVYTIEADSGGYFWHPSGSWVYVPPKAFQTKDGQRVTGKIAVNYREFRDQSDLAFSEHPMITDKGKHSRSAGMFEIKAYSYNYDGELRMKPAKELIVDFALTDTMEDARLTKLDRLTKEWLVLSSINDLALRTYGGVHFDDQHYLRRDHTFLQKVYKVTTGWAWSDERKEVWPELARGEVLSDSMARQERGLPIVPAAEETDSAYAFAPVDRACDYPTVVRGLIIDQVGVFNVSAQYGLGERKEVFARFINEERRAIRRIRDVIVIDLKKNTTFTFEPDDRITFDMSSEQALLVVTEGNEIYFMDPDQLKEVDLDRSGRIEFMMRDISVDIESPGDLKALFGSGYVSLRSPSPSKCEEGRSLLSTR